jgi:hypothetical protein
MSQEAMHRWFDVFDGDFAPRARDAADEWTDLGGES